MAASKKTVVVGMSGGVDSSVSAYLLQSQGYQVIGLFMKNWEETTEGGICHATQDYEDALNVCNVLDIPLYTVNFVKEYWDLVFSQCLKDYERGYTPNPDILCNKEIKFNLFFKKALEFGADFVATGHYCRKILQNNQWLLKKGSDPDKDQTYFLYTLSSPILAQVLFPVGDLHKKEVRAIAAEQRLATAQKKDSTGICFIGKRNFPEFLGRFLEKRQGHFETLDGEIVGSHEGAIFYTIGQRRGLGIGGKGEAWYVVDKDMKRNVVKVVQGEHPALFSNSLIATELSWIVGQPKLPLECSAKIRYRSQDALCLIKEHPKGVEVFFKAPQKAVTPRQSIVFYKNEFCLGGGIICPPQ